MSGFKMTRGCQNCGVAGPNLGTPHQDRHTKMPCYGVIGGGVIPANGTKLTSHELTVVNFILRSPGLSALQLAQRMNISIDNVRTTIDDIRKKVGKDSITGHVSKGYHIQFG